MNLNQTPHPHEVKLFPPPFGTQFGHFGITRRELLTDYGEASDKYRHAIYMLMDEAAQVGAMTALDTFSLTRLCEGNLELIQRELEAHIELATQEEHGMTPILVSLGPLNEPYNDAVAPSADDAQDGHGKIYELLPRSEQLETTILAETFCTLREALGAMTAAKEQEKPIILSFTVDEKGCLFDGIPVWQAIKIIDHYTEGHGEFSINCSGLPGIKIALKEAKKNGFVERITSIYPNASDKDVRTLDQCAETGEIITEDMKKRAEDIAQLCQTYPHLCRVGFCCGATAENVRYLKECIQQALYKRKWIKRVLEALKPLFNFPRLLIK